MPETWKDNKQGRKMKDFEEAIISERKKKVKAKKGHFPSMMSGVPFSI